MGLRRLAIRDLRRRLLIPPSRTGEGGSLLGAVGHWQLAGVGMGVGRHAKGIAGAVTDGACCRIVKDDLGSDARPPGGDGGVGGHDGRGQHEEGRRESRHHLEALDGVGNGQYLELPRGWSISIPRNARPARRPESVGARPSRGEKSKVLSFGPFEGDGWKSRLGENRLPIKSGRGEAEKGITSVRCDGRHRVGE